MTHIGTDVLVKGDVSCTSLNGDDAAEPDAGEMQVL